MKPQALAVMLPGFDPTATAKDDSGLRAAAISTLTALEESGQLTPRHALTAQLLLAVSERAGIGLQEPKTSIATTNLVRLAADLLDTLPIEEQGVADAAESFLSALAQAEAAGK